MGWGFWGLNWGSVLGPLDLALGSAVRFMVASDSL